MRGNFALSVNESPPVFRDKMVSCVELTRRNTRVDVRWFLSSLFAGGSHTRAGLEMSRSRRSQRLETEMSFCAVRVERRSWTVSQAGSRVGLWIEEKQT